MLVYLHQYREAETKGNKERDVGGSVDHDTEEYFDTDELEADEWEEFDYDGTTLNRRVATFDDVTAVSVPKDHLEEQGDVPGVTIQLRTEGGETEYVENATIIEVSDPNP